MARGFGRGVAAGKGVGCDPGLPGVGLACVVAADSAAGGTTGTGVGPTAMIGLDGRGVGVKAGLASVVGIGSAAGGDSCAVGTAVLSGPWLGDGAFATGPGGAGGAMSG